MKVGRTPLIYAATVRMCAAVNAVQARRGDTIPQLTERLLLHKALTLLGWERLMALNDGATLSVGS
jgi:hypothetical protein